MKNNNIDLKTILFLIFLIVIMIFVYNVGIYNAIKINEFCKTCGYKYNFLNGNIEKNNEINITILPDINITYNNITCTCMNET